MSSIEIRINGEQRVVKSETVSELLSELEVTNTRVAVELNRAIVSRNSYDSTTLASGDELEIIHFVGGG